MARTLTSKQKRFVDEYLIDLNATRAAVAAGYSRRTARQQGARLLSNVDIQNAIRSAMDGRAQRTQITQDRVLEHWWAIATANPNDLVQLRRCCCRYCHGDGFKYQWVDDFEFAQALAAAKAAHDPKKDGPFTPPSSEGGYGYTFNLAANPECPRCCGEGIPEVYAHDTRHLTGGALLLYAGTKPTPSGFEIKLHDQMAALDKVARHLGMYRDSLAHDITDDLIEAIEIGSQRVARHRP